MSLLGPSRVWRLARKHCISATMWVRRGTSIVSALPVSNRRITPGQIPNNLVLLPAGHCELCLGLVVESSL